MRCCDSQNLMSTTKTIGRLVAVCQKEQLGTFDKCQIPINIDENLIMKLQFDESCLTCNHHAINKTSKNYQTFIKTYQKLTVDELQNALCVPIQQIKEYIPRCISCIGCRTSIDNFMKTIIEYRHQALEPIIINEKNLFTIKKSQNSCPDYIYTLFYVHGSKLKSFIESIPKSKKNRRCNIHSLDKIKSINDWQIVWDLMNKECRDEITLVETDSLLDSLENYLYKHRFCSECKLKVLEAYDLLLDNHDHKNRDRKGFCPALYEGLRTCSNDKHIHIQSDKEFLGNLISRAESEIEDSRRERHAKTLDIAQEEILTCIGIYLYERFDKIYRIIKSEEQTWQLLFYITIDCLRLNFETIKEDFNVTLKNLYQEFCITDGIKVQKKQKKIKKKIQRHIKIDEEKNIQIENQFNEQISIDNENSHTKEQEEERRRTSSSCSCPCHSCNEILPTTTSSLIKSQSCPSSLLCPSEHKIPLSSSLETLLSSISTRYCVCQDTNSNKQPISCEEYPMSCIRCSSTRTDLGYSSELDDGSSFGLCEYSSTTCVACLTDCRNCCPLHEVDENCSESIISNDICRKTCCVNDTVIDCTKTIELCDITRKPKLKLQLSDQYPFFTMDLKQIWDETLPTIIENTSFIPDDDLEEFFLLHTHIELKRAQLREFFKLKFQTWQQQTAYKT